MQKPTFDQIPESLFELHQKLDALTALLTSNNSISEKEDKLLNVQEAAEFLNLCVPTVYAKVGKREIPFMKKSKRLYFSRQELLQYIQGGKKRTQDELQNLDQLKPKRKS